MPPPRPAGVAGRAQPSSARTPEGASVRVAYSGEPGAFAEDAMLAYFVPPRPGPSGVPRGGFRDVFEAVEAGHVSGEEPHAEPIAAGVLPIENLVNGTVREVYDLLLEHELSIVGEVVVPVRLCLAALPGQSIERIERVYSHVQALGQAEAFLRTRPWSLMTTYNTAGSAKLIVDRGETGAAAVVSPRAAGLFGLEVLADGIQSVPQNRTRFLVVARPDAPAVPSDAQPAISPPPSRVVGAADASTPGAARASTPMRTTLVMAVRNEPGSLHRCLEIFSAAGLNMSKLESRPSRDRAWEYVFWVDLDADAADPGAIAALEKLGRVTTLVRVLGCYPRAAD